MLQCGLLRRGRMKLKEAEECVFRLNALNIQWEFVVYEDCSYSCCPCIYSINNKIPEEHECWIVKVKE